MDTSKANKPTRVTLSINPHNQDLDTVHQIVAYVLNRAGCGRCGRLAFLDVHFPVGPDPELSKIGVISLETHGG